MSDFSFDDFATDFDDLPEQEYGLKPKVWALAECIEASVKANTRIDPPVPQIEVTLKILDSAPGEAGDKARGQIRDWLSKPIKDHPAMTAKACNFQRQQFRKAFVSFLAPALKKKEDQDAIVAQETRNAGGWDKALVGKQVLVKIGVNDGVDKLGNIVSEKRHTDPRNRVDDYKPATQANIDKYVKQAVGLSPFELPDSV